MCPTQAYVLGIKPVVVSRDRGLRRPFIQKHLRWLRTRNREDKVVANAHQRTLRQAIATAKHDSWRRFCKEAIEENLWNAFKKVMYTCGPQRIGTLEVDPQQLCDDA